MIVLIFLGFLFAKGLIVVNAHAPAFVFLHIAKTGGTSAVKTLPKVLRVEPCEYRYIGGMKLSRLTLNSTAKTKKKVFLRGCHFFTREMRLNPMINLLKEYNHVNKLDYELLTIFRDPFAHWISAWQHMHRKQVVQLKNDPNSRIARSFKGLVEELEQGNPHHYDLRNFQMRFFGANLTHALMRLRTEIFWFGVLEFLELSFGLLQCQLFGSVEPEVVRVHAHFVRNPSTHRGVHYQMQPDIMARLTALNRDELTFYGLVLREFWRRIEKHKQCLQNASMLPEGYDVL